MKTKILEKMTKKEIETICRRPGSGSTTDLKIVRAIISAVRKDGDTALRDYSVQFDNAKIENLKVSTEEIKEAWNKTSAKTREALLSAKKSIMDFHKLQYPDAIFLNKANSRLSLEPRPIGSVGLYVPGGQAPLVSTVLMLGVPAKIARSINIILCTPPQPTGEIDQNILVAAKIAGIKNVYKVGGAQAIAAMAYGTESIPKVDKIFGPGNRYVTTAKMLVSTDPKGAAIDMPAGPSELLVIADKNARTDFVAADLLSQAEHGVDSQVILVCTDADKVREIVAQIELQKADLPRREIVEKSLSNSFVVIVKDVKAAIRFSNLYAPEHLILNIEKYNSYKKLIQNAGSVFLGQYSSESAGDYMSGPNHTLPTSGFARTWSGLSVLDFMKRITFQELTKVKSIELSNSIEVLAQAEGLEAHRRAAQIRRGKL